MSNRHALLPREATALEIAFSETMDRAPELAAGVKAVQDVKDSPTGTALPFLISEYGLEEIEEFFPVPADAIPEGIRWRRLVGTPEAVRLALRWIGYRAAIIDQWVGRRRWNTFQFLFPTLPQSDRPDLSRIEKIADISTPFRSRFRRGVFGYDAPAASADHDRYDASMLDAESGHALHAGGPLWSFGRERDLTHLYTEAEGTALGNWLAPSGDVPLKWLDLTFPWSSAAFPWGAQSESLRRVRLSGWFRGRAVRLCLRNQAGAVIGYRSCRALSPVRIKNGGPYMVGGTGYEPSIEGDFLYAEALTGFGDADGVTAATASLAVGGTLAPGVPAGRLWLRPGDLTGAVEFASAAVSIPLRPTVRDKFKFLVRF